MYHTSMETTKTDTPKMNKKLFATRADAIAWANQVRECGIDATVPDGKRWVEWPRNALLVTRREPIQEKS